MTTTEPTITSAAIEYGDATVRIEPTVLEFNGQQIEVIVFVDAPEYSSTLMGERVLAVGAPLKKDGTPAARTVKPIVRIETLPANVREALIAARV